MFCRHFAQYIFWQRDTGYTHPCCLTCYPQATTTRKSVAGALALDGSRIFDSSLLAQA
jgi:hypothetical protein